jgi:predicted nucleic acid-binding protein
MKKPMAGKKARVFLDSNVILSGLFSDRGAPRLMLDILSLNLPILSGMTGRYNIIEIERNLGKKMPSMLPLYQSFLAQIKLEIIPLPSLKDVLDFKGAASEKDLPVLASAVDGRADYLVTGDKKLYSSAKNKSNFRIKTVEPSEFLRKVLPEILKGLS